jgi:hypothetical protein
MVSWLAKTTQLLQRRAPPEPPPPFEVGCACGHRLSGLRKPSYQAIPCHRCGNSVFVLPIDVYPKPKVKKPDPTQALAAPAAPAPPAAARLKTLPSVPAPGMQPKGAKPAAGTGTATPPGSVPTINLAEEAKSDDSVTLDVRRPLVSRFKLIVLAIAGVVGATGYFVWQSRLNDRALVSLPGHIEAGATALKAGKLPEAAEEYGQAAWAVNRLKRNDAESADIRQKAQELHAIVNLSAVPLYEICEQARRNAKAGSEKWAEKFNELYRDAWIVVEGDIVQETSPDGTGQALLQFPFPIDSAPVVIDARLKALAPVIDAAKGAPRHVIFAGQLASFKKEGTKNPLWVIRLKDDSAFLWANFDTYQAMGLSSDAAADDNDPRRILAQQATALGLKQ